MGASALAGVRQWPTKAVAETQRHNGTVGAGMKHRWRGDQPHISSNAAPTMPASTKNGKDTQ